ncbi:MAG TPA: hypothetical protein VG826_09020 [Pirellulales bacterium]|nr:hypothetical protein [Pirellulales bacterium]
MIINEATLGDLCTRVAKGDEEARRDFDRHVLPVVEAIVARWLSQQRPHGSRPATAPDNSLAENSTTEGRVPHLLPKVAAAICAQMVAQAADGRRTRPRRPCAPARIKPPAGETLSALIGRHTVSRLVPWPA